MGPDPELCGPWYSERYGGLTESKPSKETEVMPVGGKYSDEPVFETTRYLVRSKSFDVYQVI